MTAPTISPTAAAREWDAVVIGAGPAGSVAARELARRGLDVLLVDKAVFPRAKVCGCCLNQRAVASLNRLGLGSLPASLGGQRLEHLKLVSARGRQATVALAGGFAVSRSRLDEALVQHAISAGAAFLPGCAATIGDREGTHRRVTVSGTQAQARARMVFAADGLAGTSLANLRGFEPRTSRHSRIGIGAIIDDPPPAFAPRTITMVCGRHGYVGAVLVEEGRLDIAAAIDPGWMKTAGGPAAAVTRILSEAQLEVDLTMAQWRGTPPLTRRRRLEAERLFVIGDAAGYVEPFTGEGMAWALAGAEAAADIAFAQPTTSWAARHGTIVRRTQRECRVMARLLRHPPITDVAIRLLGVIPSLASPVVRRLSHGRDVPSEVIA